MKTKMMLNGHRPRVERHGAAMIITLTDVTGSTVEVDMDMTEGSYLANDIHEVVSEHRKEQSLTKGRLQF